MEKKRVIQAHPLREREKEIISLICMEYSTKEISCMLYLSLHTIEKHRENIMRKIGVKSIAGIINYGNRNGLNPQFNANENIPRDEVVGLKQYVSDAIRKITGKEITEMNQRITVINPLT